MRNFLVQKEINQDKIEELNELISDIEAKENREIIMENFKHYSDNPESINLSNMWKIVRKLWPKCGSTLPTAKKNHRGQIISGPSELKKLLAKEYKERLRSRPVRPDLLEFEERKTLIFKMKMQLAESNESSEWSISDLENALNDLKRNKSRDNEGLINEIFKFDVIGENLKLSLLLMFNILKKKKIIAEFLNYANVTTVPKRGSRMLLINERGIFRVAVVRCILMRLIYNSKYPEVDANMSDCQMGARKAKSCKNNIFIINGIIHDVMRSKKMKPVLLQIYDYSQMFDSVNLEKAISDIYDTGLKDDNLVLIYKANKEINMAVNTPSGLSERQIISNSVLQGDTFGSLLSSVQVDTIGKEAADSGYGYKYKDSVEVSLLGLVDDLIGVTEAGYKAQQMNALINVKTADKGLQFGIKKCKSMLVGKNENVLNSHLTVDNWKVTYEDIPEVGRDVLLDSFEGLISIDKTDEQKYLGFVLSNRGNNMVNINHMKNKSKGIIKKIFSKLESLHLKQYYFECAIVFMNTMLRSSILYACETYYNLKECEIRQLERIEEEFMRKLMKTSKGCPIVQLYAELGQIPARFEIIKIRLLFLKYILNQNPESLIYKFFDIQRKTSTKGDWVYMCMENLKYIEISESFEVIKKMSYTTFKNLLKKKVTIAAFHYLSKRRGSKGSEIAYSKMEMAEYLLPYSSKISIEVKCEIFGMRNKMVKIPANYSARDVIHKCISCNNEENMEHVYTCKLLNSEEPETEYKQIYSNNLDLITKVHRRFVDNMGEREQKLIEIEKEQNYKKDFSTVIHLSDPLYPVPVYSNG